MSGPDPVYEGPCKIGTQWTRNPKVENPVIRTVLRVHRASPDWVVTYSSSDYIECAPYNNFAVTEPTFLANNYQILPPKPPTEEEKAQAADKVLNFQNYKERTLNV